MAKRSSSEDEHSDDEIEKHCDLNQSSSCEDVVVKGKPKVFYTYVNPLPILDEVESNLS